MKVFGTLKRESGEWVVSAQADIATRLKRIFPRVQATRLGDIRILDSLEVCRDLEWVLNRWPLEISKGDRQTLTRGANGHRNQQERVTAVLDGRAKHASLPMTPAPGREPRDYQQIAYDLSSTTGSLLLADELGLGKAQPLDALVLTPGGFIPMSKVRHGTTICTPDGGTAPVRGVFPQGDMEEYEVQFSDGSSTRCSDTHLWTVRHARGPTRRKDGTQRDIYWKTVTLRELIDSDLRTSGGQAKWHIPVTAPVEGVERELTLDPYFLGILLGDGTLGQGNRVVRFASADQEIIDEVQRLAPSGIEVVHASKYDYCLSYRTEPLNCVEDQGKCGRPVLARGLCGRHYQRLSHSGSLPGLTGRQRNPVMQALEELGLRGHTSRDKFIPRRYLTASSSQRLALLQGLLDADGYAMPLASGNATAQFYSSSVALADGVVYLTRSLGGIARLTSKWFKGARRYAVTVKLPAPLNPFRLSRKAQAWGDGHQTLTPTRAITTVRKTGNKVPMQCISVDRKDGLYVTDDFVVTHNTESSLLSLSDPANRPMLAVTLAGGMPRQWVRELNDIFPDLRGVEVTKAKPYDLADKDGNEPDLIVMNYAKLAGWSHHLMGKVNSVVFDEVQELRREGTQKHTAAQMVAGPARVKIGASATPVYNYGGEMYSILKVLAPDLVGDKAEFGREWCQAVYGLDQKARIVDPPGFRHWMTDQGVFLRRTREEVGISMPPLNVQEYSIDVDSRDWKELIASSDVAQVASLILSEDAPHRDRWRASGDLDYKMRHATGVAKAPYVAEVAKLILESEEKIILAGWHREVWDTWQESLAAYSPVLYTGTESSAGKARAFDAFREGDSRILMLSLRSGAGLDGLQESCQVVVFGELDWSPGVHKQVLGRLHRPGQKAPVSGYFCVSDYGADPAMLDTLDLKKIEAEMLVNSDQEIENQFEEIDPRTKGDYLREMAKKAIHDARGARKEVA